MINCERCGDEFPEILEILEENLPVPRYTHCDKCYRIQLSETFKAMYNVLENMEAQNGIDKTNERPPSLR